jgi:hypothetical protein
MRPEPTPPDDLSNALDEALGEEPRAVELRRMTDTLRDRQNRLRVDLDAESNPQQREKIEREIAKLDEQIAVLREESDISQFIEDSVRVGVEMRKLQEGF